MFLSCLEILLAPLEHELLHLQAFLPDHEVESSRGKASLKTVRRTSRALRHIQFLKILRSYCKK